MQIGVLGPLRIVLDGVERDAGPAKQRALLAALALHPNRVVTVDTLVEQLWPTGPPLAVSASLHGYVAGLRRVLEPSRAARSQPSVLVTSGRGYLLRTPPAVVDAAAFADVVQAATRWPGAATDRPAPGGGEATIATDDLDRALGWWRGEPFAELDDPDARAERARLVELRLAAVSLLARAELEQGRVDAAVARLTPEASDQPLREDLWTLLATALARAGRQADALAAIRTVRDRLADELGVEVGPQLQRLEVAILRQEPDVTGASPAGARTGPQHAVSAAAVPVAAAPDVPAVGGATEVLTVESTTDDVGSAGLSGDPYATPLVGRRPELDALDSCLRRTVTAADPQYCVLVGEPGIGKTRLLGELAGRAGAAGFTVLTGRCSSDEGAPPLWPWRAVLAALSDVAPDAGLPAAEVLLQPGIASTADRFQLFDQVAAGLAAAARRRPVLVVLDDLHWADPSSLRLLQHLVETVTGAPLLVAATRRSHPEPTGPLAELAASLARRGALRIELSGITSAEVSALAGSLDTALDVAAANALRERTGGNPFFLVELLRLGGTTGRTAVPAPVGDVITARAATLPAGTRALLDTAATLSRDIDPAFLARVHGVGLDDTLDGLEPAIAAGLVVADPATGALRFGHALVRDALDATAPVLRRQRLHARAATLLAERAGPDRLAQIAEHWLRAGPAYASVGWRAAAEAARYASDLAAYDEAAALLAAALDAQRSDPEAGPDDRYDLLMARALACRGAADSAGQQAATSEAMPLASDVERLARAAITTSEGALWSNRRKGEVHPPTVAALRRAVRELPATDSALRCRVLLALSRELFWTPGGAEPLAWAEQGLAMARRLGDSGLRAWACQTMLVADQRPPLLAERALLAAESLAAARAAGDAESEAVALFWSGVLAGEGGRPTDRERDVRAAMEIAGRLRLRYLQVMLGAHEVPWLTLHGRFAEAAERLDLMSGLAAPAEFAFRLESVAAAQACLAMWQNRAADVLAAYAATDVQSPTDMGTSLLLLLVRAGQLDAAAHHLDRRPIPLDVDDFAASMDLSIGAEVALVLHRPQLAADVYPLLLPLAGRIACAGIAGPIGPVDAYLALAAAAVGETGIAAEHAAAALRQCEDWQMPPVAAWFIDLRERFAF